jgi:hypothetical protein
MDINVKIQNTTIMENEDVCTWPMLGNGLVAPKKTNYVSSLGC